MNIGEANAVNVLIRRLFKVRGNPADDQAVREAATLLARGAYKALFAGVIPGDLEDAELRGLGKISVLDVRDPDSDCTTTVYVDGRRVEAEVEQIDPGRGYEAQDWLTYLEYGQNLPDSDFKTDYLEAMGNPPGTEFIQGWDEVTQDA